MFALILMFRPLKFILLTMDTTNIRLSKAIMLTIKETLEKSMVYRIGNKIQ